MDIQSWTFQSSKFNSLKVLNNADYDAVPEQIKRWNKANGKILEGLIRRREAEALLFEGKDWSNV
jgi:lysozyme